MLGSALGRTITRSSDTWESAEEGNRMQKGLKTTKYQGLGEEGRVIQLQRMRASGGLGGDNGSLQIPG